MTEEVKGHHIKLEKNSLRDLKLKKSIQLLD